MCAFEVELEVQQGPSAGERHVLNRFPVFVGRGNDADVQLAADADDRTLSRRHLKISVGGGRIIIVDVSTNGTWVGQRHLKTGEEVTLSGGEPIWLGPRTLIVLRMLGPSFLPPETQPAVAVPAPRRDDSAFETAVIPQPRHPADGAADTEAAGIDLSIQLLGPVHVQAGGVEVQVWPARKAMVLLACLADGPAGRVMAPERLIDLLWPDTLADARAALQATVSRLRRAFRSSESGMPDPVDLERGGYRLSPAYRVRCDARTFEVLCEDASQLHASEQRAESAALLEQAVALYRGPFLEGYADDWVQTRRETLQGRYFDAVDLLGELREWQGNAAGAVRLFESVLEREPCRERSQIGLMRSLAASGRRDEALRRYDAFIRRLKKEMGLAPGPELLRMYESIKE